MTHYFSFLKAKEELGYVPMVTPREGMAATISYWKERQRKSLDGPTIYAWMFCVVGILAHMAAAFLPGIGPIGFLRSLSLFLFRSMWMTRLVFILAVAAHVGEAIYAWNLARRVDPANCRGWFWQTLLLGFFSLRFLLKRAGK